MRPQVPRNVAEDEGVPADCCRVRPSGGVNLTEKLPQHEDDREVYIKSPYATAVRVVHAESSLRLPPALRRPHGVSAESVLGDYCSYGRSNTITAVK